VGYVKMTREEELAKQREALANYELVNVAGKNSEGKHWWLLKRELADKRTLYLYPNGTGVSLGLSQPGDEWGYRDVYDFFDVPFLGWIAGLRWDGEGEPIGWNRASRAGHHTRRRVGGFGEEYVDPHDLETAPNLPTWGSPSDATIPE
jgi:hypothetical protein